MKIMRLALSGVSATHLDWTMVPYVKKSFRKHFVDGLKYVQCIDIDWNEPDDLSILDKRYTVYRYDDVDYVCYDAYDYAYDMTVKECYQAVEGMYHNLKY